LKKRERTLLYAKFQRKIKERDPICFYYKIPDTIGLGGKRPFDSILIVCGVPFAIEFKSEGDKITRYQEETLKNFDHAGGIPLVFTDGEDMDVFIDNIVRIVWNKKNERR